ncbi:MAG TPA: pantoate--beta-alanine ligase [Geothrix sp.]|uniref:pantoate--beta-alanine ligase n=1 Tax=Geothrix mesophila TaxID=2922723 RepID=UPI001FAC9AF8|nr:pantoate--beta-alanine ligase [Geothrix sp. SG198]HJV37486.1 pantoate--beta-alanine ligase [Geothrix sp.]
MRVVRSIADLRALLRPLRDEGKRIGFVPTMGFLHEGHGALIRQSAARCDATVVSIFVNPTQFGPGEDLASYPRDLERDQNLCLETGATVLFMPEVSEIYPTGFQTHVEPGHLADTLCGRYRPGHFRGVATVVAKLFNIVQPDLAFFGQKDFQQTAVIRRMARDLNLTVDVVVVPTVREADGLALSSRNTYLDEDGRKRALTLSQGLLAAKAAFEEGEREPAKLLALARSLMTGADSIQYLELVDAQTLEPLQAPVDRSSALCVAAYVGSTRLIDNVLLTPPTNATGTGGGQGA